MSQLNINEFHSFSSELVGGFNPHLKKYANVKMDVFSPGIRVEIKHILPETNSSNLKMDGWNTTFPFGMAYFQGPC